jgi:dolichyl-phosphate-mannose-protein mannosyltransferase
LLSEQKTRLILILLVLSAALHLFRLSSPREVVFDEVHFGSFVNSYCCSGRYIFDIHPPHAKLLIAGVARLGGYEGGQDFATLGAPMDQAWPALLRFAPALAGMLIPIALFVLLSELGASPMAAFLGGLAATLDNALLVQTRVIALDGILLISIFGALALFLVARRSSDRVRRTLFAFLAGLLAGLAAGTKFTGLAALALIGLCVAVDFLRKPGWNQLRAAASLSVWILFGALFIYTVGWYLHFALLTEPGPGYIWGAPGRDFASDAVNVHRSMLSSNYGLRATHPNSSPWWSWPLMVRAIFYWSEGNASIYFLGNPILWWGSTLGLIVVSANLLLLKATNLRIAGPEKPRERRLWIPLVGYGIALAPLVPVPRALFLYHYLTALLFALCVVILWLDRVGWSRDGGWKDQRLSFHAVTVALVLGFLAISPFTFSFVNLPTYREFLFGLFPSWR